MTTFLITVISILLTMPNASVQELTGAELRQLGRRALEAGKYADAEQLFRRALQKFEPDIRDDELARTLADLASVLTSSERYREAEEVAKHALEIITKRGSTMDPDLMRLLTNNLATVYRSTGRLDLAERTFTHALRSAQQSPGGDAGYNAILLGNLAAVHVDMGQNKLAEKEIRQALVLAEQKFGKDRAELEPLWVNLASIYERRKKWVAAESILIQTLALIENSLGADHPDLGFLLEHLGSVHIHQNKLDLAEAELRRALEIEHRTNRVGGIRIGSISFYLGQVLSAEHKYGEARNYYSEALDRQERSLGLKSLEVARTLEQYAKLLHTMRDDTLAHQMEVRVRQIRAEHALTVSVGDQGR